MSVRISCPWCRQMQPINPGEVSYCAQCGHNPGVPVEACNCLLCLSKRSLLPGAEGVTLVQMESKAKEKIAYGKISLEATAQGLMIRLTDTTNAHNRADVFIHFDSLKKAMMEVHRLKKLADESAGVPPIPRPADALGTEHWENPKPLPLPSDLPPLPNEGIPDLLSEENRESDSRKKGKGKGKGKKSDN